MDPLKTAAYGAPQLNGFLQRFNDPLSVSYPYQTWPSKMATPGQLGHKDLHWGLSGSNHFSTMASLSSGRNSLGHSANFMSNLTGFSPMPDTVPESAFSSHYQAPSSAAYSMYSRDPHVTDDGLTSFGFKTKPPTANGLGYASLTSTQASLSACQYSAVNSSSALA